MEGSIIELSKYRLSRGKEDYEAAKVNLESGHLKASLNSGTINNRKSLIIPASDDYGG